jgi:hypothetical protein
MFKSSLLAIPCALCLSGALLVDRALAMDGAGIDVGYGTSNTHIEQLQVRWNWQEDHLDRWFAGRDWHLVTFLEASLASWSSNESGNEHLWDLGIAPVFRYQSLDRRGYYLEGAIGGHWLSSRHLSDKRVFGTRFSFGDYIGFGKRLGTQGKYELGYRFVHYSNANIKLPNPGMNFHQLHLAYNY